MGRRSRSGWTSGNGSTRCTTPAEAGVSRAADLHRPARPRRPRGHPAVPADRPRADPPRRERAVRPCTRRVSRPQARGLARSHAGADDPGDRAGDALRRHPRGGERRSSATRPREPERCFRGFRDVVARHALLQLRQDLTDDKTSLSGAEAQALQLALTDLDSVEPPVMRERTGVVWWRRQMPVRDLYGTVEDSIATGRSGGSATRRSAGCRRCRPR